MKKTGLILAGLIGGMVMLGSAPALAEGYTTAPVFASSHDDDGDVDIDNIKRVEQTNTQSQTNTQDTDVNVIIRQELENEIEEEGYTAEGLTGLIEAVAGIL